MVVSKASVSAKKGHVTRTLRECEAIVNSEELDKVKLDIAVQNLKTKLNNYQQLYDQYETQELETRTEEDFESEAEVHSQYEQYTVEELSKYVNILEKIKGQAVHREVGKPSKPKLPTIALIQFEGDILEWVPFWDSFKSLVDDRKDLDDVEKITYLRSCLKGQAAELIIGYQTSRASYGDALKALKDKYADEDKIKQHLCHLLIDMKPPSYNLTALTAYLNEYQSIIRNLKQYVDNVEGSNWFLKEMLLRKLPSQVETLLFTKLCKHYFTVEEVEQGIKDSIQHLTKLKDKQAVQTTSQVRSSKPSAASIPTARSQEQITKASFSPTKHQSSSIGSYQVETKGDKKKPNCLYCQGGHATTECDKYVTLKEKRDRLKELNRCARCVSKTHEEKDCTLTLIMCRKCKRGKHHTALCIKRGAGVKSFEAEKSEATTSQQAILSVKTNQFRKSTALPTATVEICNHSTGKKIVTRALFDQGSQCTFITKSLSSQLDLKVYGTARLALSGFLATKECEEYETVRPTIRIGGRRKKIDAVVLEHLPSCIHIPGLKKAAEMLRESGIPLADKYLNDNSIDGINLIIGADYYGDFITSVTTRYQIQLAKSSGGYLIYGKIPSEGQEDSSIIQNTIVARMCAEVSPVEITEVIEEETIPIHKLWDLDTIGINPSKPSPEDNSSYNAYLDTVKYDHDQYWVQLPWKVDCPILPTNYTMALGQLKSLTNTLKLKNDLQTYHQLIETQLENNFIEKVEPYANRENCHYLPHHAVKKDSLTTPLRIVFNCSAKRGNHPSLNDCLMKGPSMTEKLGDVLLRFRTDKFAYSADISKAFLRVGLQECDQDFTRFLWYEDPNENDTIITYRFKSVLFGATCSPFLLQATLDTHLRNSTNEYIRAYWQKFLCRQLSWNHFH